MHVGLVFDLVSLPVGRKAGGSSSCGTTGGAHDVASLGPHFRAAAAMQERQEQG